MNTPNIRKLLTKLIKLITLSLFLIIDISIISYGKELINKTTSNIPSTRNHNNTDESLLNNFIRDNSKLEVYATAVGIDLSKNDDPILANLPFRGLYHKLQNKLLSLAVAEAQDALSKDLVTEEMQKVMNMLITETSGGFDRAVLAFREKFKAYPNTADLISLTAASLYDAKEIAELTHALDELSTKDNVPNKELLGMIFADAIDGYKNFVATNEDALEIISKLADNGFKFEDLTVECKSSMGKELCETQKSTKEIKNFSEIMPYVEKTQEERAQGTL